MARRPAARRSLPAIDENVAIAGWLLDYSAAQGAEPRKVAYRRAATAILRLPIPASTLVSSDGLRDVRFVGPASARIVAEVLAHGESPTVNAAVEAHPKRAAIEAARAWRRGFISQATAEQVLDAVAGDPDSLVAQFQGDLQMHSTWSDGAQTIEAIVAESLRLGRAYAGVTDHSHGLPIAGGLTEERMRRQHAEIDALNRANGGRFRVFKGIEANIAADGTLDLSLDECRLFDYIVAAPHSALRSRADQTARMRAAVEHPFTDILGHPRGRRFNTRPGVAADWRVIFAAAAERRVAIELDGYPDRQDMDYELARAALEAGCVFALDSDAHAVHELTHVRMAMAHALIAGIPADRVLNCWSEARLDEWFRDRRRPRRGGRATP